MRLEKFVYRLKKRHGQEFLMAIKDLRYNPFLSGSAIAEKFGLSRERVRQICDIIYGKGFLSYRKRELYSKKQLFLLCQKWKESKDLKKQVYVLVIERLQKMGLEPVLYGKVRLRLLKIKNNKLIKFKILTKVTRLNGHAYYVVHVNAPSVKKSDILIVALYIQEKFHFFIFPRKIFAEKSYLCIDAKTPQKSIYKKYLNKWDILDLKIIKRGFKDGKGRKTDRLY